MMTRLNLLSVFFVALAQSTEINIQVSSTLTVQFYWLEFIHDSQWADDYYYIQDNSFVGDSGSDIFLGTYANNALSLQEPWNTGTGPAIDQIFHVNSTLISNFGTFASIPDGTTVTTLKSYDYSQFYMDGSTLKYIKYDSSSDYMEFYDIPHGIGNGQYAKGIRLNGASSINLNDGSYFQTGIVSWGGNPSYPQATSVIAFRSTDRVHWQYLSTVADASQITQCEEGPNEHDCTYLPYDERIFCLIRVDAGDGPNHVYHNYVHTFSEDNGKTWSPLETTHIGCARPRLLLLDNILIASGGRFHSGGTGDVLMWIDEDAQAQNFVEISMSYIHNYYIAASGDSNLDKYKYTSYVNSTSCQSCETTSYTSLINLNKNNTHGVITYDQILGSQKSTWAMLFRLIVS